MSNVVHGDSRQVLATMTGQVDLIFTSPPYADARKKHYDSIDPNVFPEWFLAFSDVFAKCLKPSGSLVINIKDKVVNGVRNRYVWRTLMALESAGWCAIDDYVWQKPNPMPGYWPSRLSDAWEYCFHLSRSTRPYFSHESVKKPIGSWAEPRLRNLDELRNDSATGSGFGRDLNKWKNKATVLPNNVVSVPLVGRNKQHPAVFPLGLPRFFIKLLCPPDGLVVDPFGGSGTTAVAALQENRRAISIDNNAAYCEVALSRIQSEVAP